MNDIILLKVGCYMNLTFLWQGRDISRCAVVDEVLEVLVQACPISTRRQWILRACLQEAFESVLPQGMYQNAANFLSSENTQPRAPEIHTPTRDCFGQTVIQDVPISLKVGVRPHCLMFAIRDIRQDGCPLPLWRKPQSELARIRADAPRWRYVPCLATVFIMFPRRPRPVRRGVQPEVIGTEGVAAAWGEPFAHKPQALRAAGTCDALALSSVSSA
jgi:hypothetical protein